MLLLFVKSIVNPLAWDIYRISVVKAISLIWRQLLLAVWSNIAQISCFWLVFDSWHLNILFRRHTTYRAPSTDRRDWSTSFKQQVFPSVLITIWQLVSEVKRNQYSTCPLSFYFISRNKGFRNQLKQAPGLFRAGPFIAMFCLFELADTPVSRTSNECKHDGSYANSKNAD